MRSRILLSLCLVAVVTAHAGNKTSHAGNKTSHKDGSSAKDQCREIKSLSHIVNLASNTTKLDEITKGNATKIAEIQAKASSASTKLQTLQSNSTLASTCAVIDAAAAEKKACEETFALQKFIAFAANSTEVATRTHDNSTKVAEVAQKASAAAVKLQTLTSNSTLQAACAVLKQKKQCKELDALQRVVDGTNKRAELEERIRGNATKIEKFEAKLNALKANATFVAACDALKDGKSDEGSKGGSDDASASSVTKAEKSGGGGGKGASHWGLAASIILVVGGMVML